MTIELSFSSKMALMYSCQRRCLFETLYLFVIQTLHCKCGIIEIMYLRHINVTSFFIIDKPIFLCKFAHKYKL